MDNSVVTCTRRFQFCSGHRVHLHESKCNHVHGHNYVILVTAIAPVLDNLGRVIDFGEIKEKLGTWIDENWDHGMILFQNDPLAACWGHDPLLNQKHFIMPSNPTAENMALFLLHNVCPVLFKDSHVVINKVTVWETENCYAEAMLVHA